MAASAGGDVAAEELLTVPGCKVVMLPVQGGDTVLVAEGTLRALLLPPATESEQQTSRRLVLSVCSQGGDKCTNEAGFYYPVLRETPFCVAADGRCVTFPAELDNRIYGLEIGHSGGLQDLAEQLAAFGCTVQSHGKAASSSTNRAAGAVQQTGEAVASALTLASGVLAWGIKQAASTAKKSSLMVPTEKPVAVPAVVQQEVGYAREATHNVVMLSGMVVDSLAQTAGKMANHVGKCMQPKGTDGDSGGKWQDAQVVGKTTVEAGVNIFAALGTAMDQIVQSVADSSADLVGHKFGEEAGNTVRDGIHTGGNLMAAQGAISKKAVAKTVATQSAAGLVGAGSTSTSDPTAPVGLQLGPSSSPPAQAQAAPAQQGSTGLMLGPRPPK